MRRKTIDRARLEVLAGDFSQACTQQQLKSADPGLHHTTRVVASAKAEAFEEARQMVNALLAKR